MNAKLLLAGAGVVALIAATRKRSSSSGPTPAPAGPATLPPITVTPAPASSAKPPKPKPVAPQIDMPQTVMLPIGWRRLASTELTPELEDVARQVQQAGFAVGTFNPFDVDGTHYAAMIERGDDGRTVVSLAVEGA